ncbi:hypothetical protein SERLA73DRAFT_175803, partial [Serpula lacrymans var. lacrymans S7.3]
MTKTKTIHILRTWMLRTNEELMINIITVMTALISSTYLYISYFVSSLTRFTETKLPQLERWLVT